jgi:hypothetical protein
VECDGVAAAFGIKSTAAWQPLPWKGRLGGGRFCYPLHLGNSIRIDEKGYNSMSTSTYSLPELLRKWAQGELTTE